MNFEVHGRVIQNPVTQTGNGANGPWGRTQIVIEITDGNHTKKLALENKKKFQEFALLQVGQTGTFKFDISSREWNGKWYTSAECWSWSIDEPRQQESSDRPF